MADKKRVDVALVERGLAPSREKAQARGGFSGRIWLEVVDTPD